MNLTVENVVQELLDSDEHGLTALKENAIEFILNNAVEVIQSPSWPMVYESPALWNQLFIESNLYLLTITKISQIQHHFKTFALRLG